MKKSLRTPYRPLAQLCRRFHEQYFVKNWKPNTPPSFEILENDENAIHKIKYKQFVVKTVSPDNTLIMKDKTIIKVKAIRMTENNVVIRGKV